MKDSLTSQVDLVHGKTNLPIVGRSNDLACAWAQADRPKLQLILKTMGYFHTVDNSHDLTQSQVVQVDH